MHVLGRRRGTDGANGKLGNYRARDGSDGSGVGVDLDRPHAWLVVGKRGSGKSHTLGVLAEELARTEGVAPIVLDPMGGLSGLATDETEGATAPEPIRHPTVRAAAIPPSSWPALFGLEPTGPVGSLLWQAASEAGTLASMREHLLRANASESARRGAQNHLGLAESWAIFDADGITPGDLLDGGAVIDLSGLAPAPANAVARAVVDGLYGHCVRAGPGTIRALPWVLVDEAHAFFDGIAGPSLRRVLTRGRAPGVSLVAATQRPSALPDVALSQADILLAHRLTAETDVAALAGATPTYLRGSLRDRLPDERGCAVVIDDATESVHGIRVRERRTTHGGASPRTSEIVQRGRTGGIEIPE